MAGVALYSRRDGQANCACLVDQRWVGRAHGAPRVVGHEQHAAQEKYASQFQRVASAFVPPAYAKLSGTDLDLGSRYAKPSWKKPGFRRP